MRGAERKREPFAGLRWRINRLKAMSPAEVGHRVIRAVAARAEQAGFLEWRHVRPAQLRSSQPTWVHVPRDINPAPYLAAAERAAAGRLDVLSLRDCDLGMPPRWNRDPRTGVEPPLDYGMLLDYRDPSVAGDVRHLWEPNRHLHFVTLAQAWALTRERRWFDALAAQLDSWLRACPYRKGVNWSSALEPAVRLINWAIAWQLLGGAESPLFADAGGARLRERWLDSVHQHAQFVRGHFSLYSSANNHLIGEAAGLWVAALTWPCWPDAAGWRDAAREILEREVLLQNAPDGVNREQAVSYQQFELDLLLVAELAGRAHGRPLPPPCLARMEAMLEFLASIMDSGGHLPMFGDSDDGMLLRLDPTVRDDEERARFRSLLATGAVLFGRGDFKARAGRLDDKSRWLLGDGAQGVYHSLPGPSAGAGAEPLRRAFPEGGYYILGGDWGTPRELRLVADAGPLGYGAIAAHGHADALSFTLSVGGEEILVDPGTYAYHAQPLWRGWFRGTGAHSTVQVDGEDQSESGGAFLWLRKARAGCSAWVPGEAADRFEGWHDGYLRLADPVMHRRSLVLDKKARRIRIEDRLEMAGEHDIALRFHFSERCGVHPDNGSWRIRCGEQNLLLRLPQHDGASIAAYRGSTAPLAGWRSRRFGEKVPAPTIVWRARLRGAVRLTSEIVCL
jgi:hypothetical protein